MARPLYRQESLDKLTSPDELDRLFTAVPLRAWLPLVLMAVLAAGSLTWAALGRIPDTVEGAGALVNPGRVRGLQAAFGGQVIDLRGRVGQSVRAGDALAVVNQPELRQSLAQAQNRLRELRRTDATQSKLEADRAAAEKAARDSQEAVLRESIAELESSGAALAVQYQDAARVEREQLVRARAESKELNVALKEQFAALQKLAAKSLVTQDTVVAARAQLAENNLRLAELELKSAEMRSKDIELQQSRAQLKTKASDLRSQIRQLDARDRQLELDRSQAAAGRAAAVQEQADRVAQYDRMLDEQGQLRSPYAGRILELPVAPGQVVAAGARVGAIELDSADGDPGLRMLAYFPLATGKRLRDGMTARVTPSTVQRERFGSITGRVVRVSPFPVTEEAAAAVVGNAEVVRALAHPGGMIEVEIELDLDPESASGFKWTSAGPPFKFSAGTTAAARVAVEERAPISYLFPLVKGL